MNGLPTDALLLRSARIAAGKSVREVATAAGVSVDAVRRAEKRGVKNVRVSRVVRLCEALGIPIDSLRTI